MNIFWHGQFCFSLIANPSKNGQVKIVIDPFGEEAGLKIPKLSADILLITHQHSANNLKAVGGDFFLIDGPGEYEVKEIFIQGIPSSYNNSSDERKKTNTIYTIETEDLRICHLGELSQKELSDEQLDKIGEIDILMIPVGGANVISAKEAVKIMSQIEPKIILPMYYHLPKLKFKLDGIDKFLKTIGVKKLEPLPKLAIKKKDILVDEVKVILLSHQ
ncbi:MAG: MBL fold metallo-hydrolase [Minisyncoccales bacterium]